MPRIQGTPQTIVKKGGSITFKDWSNRTLSQTIQSLGGDVSEGDITDLAELIADASNATYTRAVAKNSREWKDADLTFFDEAEASVEKVIVIVFLHDTDSRRNQEVLIPAYDASLIVPGGGNQVNISDARITAIATAAVGILNDRDVGDLSPDEYHVENIYAYTTTRKVSNGRGTVNPNLPAPIEATNADSPGDEPGNLPA